MKSTANNDVRLQLQNCGSLLTFHTGGNFINILYARFWYESVFFAKTKLEKAAKKTLVQKKRARKMLMKLTTERFTDLAKLNFPMVVRF